MSVFKPCGDGAHEAAAASKAIRAALAHMTSYTETEITTRQIRATPMYNHGEKHTTPEIRGLKERKSVVVVLKNKLNRLESCAPSLPNEQDYPLNLTQPDCPLRRAA